METKLGKFFVLVILFLLGAPWISLVGKKRSRMICCVLFAAACASMCGITLFSRSGGTDRTALLVPFSTYAEALNVLPLNVAPYLKDGKLTLREMLLAVSYSFQYIGLNILLFVPFGYLLKKLYGHKNGMWVTLYGMLFSLLIECTQYTFRLGCFDIDDIISNVLGTCMGYAACLATDQMMAKVESFLTRKDQRNRDG